MGVLVVWGCWLGVGVLVGCITSFHLLCMLQFSMLGIDFIGARSSSHSPVDQATAEVGDVCVCVCVCQCVMVVLNDIHF